MASQTWRGFLRLEPFDASEDPHAAPGAYKGDDAAPPWSLRRAGQNRIWIYTVGVVFLIFSVGSIIDSGPTGVQWVIRIGQVVGIAVGYVCAAWVCDLSLTFRWCYVAAFTALLLSTFPFMDWSFVYYGIYVTILLSTLIPWRQSRVAILISSLIVMVIAVAIQEWAALSIGLTGLFVGWASGAGMEAGRLSRKLEDSRRRVSVLAVSAERERIGRDLHDILGHSLTAISIKSGLAGRLIEHDPAAARAEMADIEEIARQALADVRSTATGYHEVRVASEIASARSVLMAAGIEARVPSAIDPLPPEVSELFGYVIREAVTNVVRHSGATWCVVTVDAEAVTVSDDGRGCAKPGSCSGSGLQGLAHRLGAAGGSLLVEPRPGGGTVVRGQRQPAVVPVDGPRAARA
jgi:two-component system sensor histidine kinase DesK